MTSVQRRPLVVVSQRIDFWHAREEQRDGLDHRLVAWVLQVGLLPVPMPNTLGMVAGAVPAWLAAVEPQGVVLSGGNDLGERFCRDETEIHLIDYASERRLPLLGICRGMQRLSTWAGAELIPVQGHVNTRHRLLPVGGASAWPEQVNSFHNYTVKDCPSGFTALALAEQGEIEAIKHLDLPWEAWMWHPERNLEFDAADIKRARLLFGLSE